MLERFLHAASTYAGDIDELVVLITLIVGAWFLVAEFVFFALIFKFTAKDGEKAKYVAGESWKEKRWVTIPHYAVLVFDVLIIIAAIRVWVNVKQTMPEADQTVRVISQQWAWTFVHPGPDGKLDTPDDIRTVDELRLERDKVYHFELTSKDVLHSFSVPAFRLKQDAVPGRVIRGWFKPTLTGTFDIQCAEICGIGHALMPGRIVVDTPEGHRDWLQARQGAFAGVATAEPAQGADAAPTPASGTAPSDDTGVTP